MMIPTEICIPGTFFNKNTPGLHRVAVGASGSSPAHPHGAPTHIPVLVSPRASFHSPLHCMLYINEIHRDYINKTHHGLHRVAVGATGRSPAHPHGAPRAYPGVAVTAGELPLAPTLHIVHQRNTLRLPRQKMHCVYIAPTLHVVNERNTSVLHAPAYCTSAICTAGYVAWLIKRRQEALG